MVLSIGTSWSQGLPCNGQVNVSIGTNCQVQLTPATMHQANTGTIVSINIVDFGLKSNVSTADLNAIFPGATIVGSGANRLVQRNPLIVVTSAITGARSFSGKSYAEVGMVITKVSVFQGTNSCWGTVMIEDKLPPTIAPVRDVTVSCLITPLDDRGNPMPSVTGDVVATGSCSQVIKQGYVDKVTD